MRFFVVLTATCLVSTVALAEPNTPSTYGPAFTNNSTGTVGGGSNFLSAIEHYFNWHPGNGSVTYTGVPTVIRSIQTPITADWLRANGISTTTPRHFDEYPGNGGGSANGQAGGNNFANGQGDKHG